VIAASTPDSAAPAPPLDLSHPRRLHVVGVGGPGMSAIALALAEMGHDVSGVDIRDRPAFALPPRYRSFVFCALVSIDGAHCARHRPGRNTNRNCRVK